MTKNSRTSTDILAFIRETFNTQEFIPLHAPVFAGEEKKYVMDCLDSTFVSSVSQYVQKVEDKVCEITGSKFAVAVTNGTVGLHLALLAAGVEREDEVITQALTFVATGNAINYTGAQPVFLDVDETTMGLSAKALQVFLENNTEQKNGACYNKKSGKRIKACVPMHTFGFPMEIEAISELCKQHNVVLVEDAAESIGSFVGDKHTGTFGELACLSFNGNKTVTAGMGGMILTQNEDLAKWLKHVSTTAKKPHAFEFYHDEIGYNYRMAGLNASLLYGQLMNLDNILKAKRKLAGLYQEYFNGSRMQFITEQSGTKANYWLNTIRFATFEERNDFLTYANENGVMCRPIWNLLNKLPMFKDAETDGLEVSSRLEATIVNIPSSFIPELV
jgi:aminotransferase in exopolysaccharide biosynthesis